MKLIACLGFLTVVATACVDEDTFLDPADYDRSCSDKTDCVIVSVGDLCSASCEESAIRRTDYSRYLADRDAITCPEPTEPFVSLCVPTEPFCEGGVCVVH